MTIEEIGIFKLVLEVVIFVLLMFLGEAVLKRLDKTPVRILNPKEYFPDEEIHSLRQIFYLIMMSLFFVNILYTFIFVNNDSFYLSIFDIVLSLYLATTLDKSTIKNKILLILLVPYGSLTYIVFGGTLVGLVDFIHIPIFAYFIYVYYMKFREYTRSHGLGIAVLLLFSIIFFSFMWTQFAESVNPLDSLVMVSNAFTSNGYAVLGKTIPGKINSLILVWGGYLLSGVGTATLASGILITHFRRELKKYDKRFDELEELIKKNNEE